MAQYHIPFKGHPCHKEREPPLNTLAPSLDFRLTSAFFAPSSLSSEQLFALDSEPVSILIRVFSQNQSTKGLELRATVGKMSQGGKV